MGTLATILGDVQESPGGTCCWAAWLVYLLASLFLYFLNFHMTAIKFKSTSEPCIDDYIGWLLGSIGAGRFFSSSIGE